MGKNVKSQMNALFFDTKATIYVLRFLTTFKIASNTNRIHEEAVMCILSHYVSETLATALDSLMCTTDKSSSVAASVRNADTGFSKLLRSYPEV